MAFICIPSFNRYGTRASKNGRKSFRSPPNRRKVMLKVLKMANFVICKLMGYVDFGHFEFFEYNL